ncbi:MAG: substrate-binding domain-containing protein [Thermoprotei archaeon]|jgi:molybdate transport repressor ModE-like protein
MLQFKLQTKLNFIFNNVVIDEELIELLKEIKRSSSLILAAKKIHVSYRYAWKKLNETSNALKIPLVITVRGGKFGGRTELTITGEELLRRYELFTKYASIELQDVFKKYVIDSDISIVGSHCPGVELALKMMASKNPELRFHVENVGSLNGLMSVEKGKADIAGIHLLDPESEKYNEPYIKKLNLKNITFVKGYKREQGLIVRKGNPKGIRNIADIIAKKGIFVNRNVGSGTRILFEALLYKTAEKLRINFEDAKNSIRYYPHEANSHAEIAQIILKGYADVGLGIRTVADQYGLDFIPLVLEEYDFVINNQSIKNPAVKRFLMLLSSRTFKQNLIKLLTGIQPTENTGKVKKISDTF